jgi:hypothetical protein
MGQGEDSFVRKVDQDPLIITEATGGNLTVYRVWSLDYLETTPSSYDATMTTWSFCR